jgi:hypothetical protein
MIETRGRASQNEIFPLIHVSLAAGANPGFAQDLVGAWPLWLERLANVVVTRPDRGRTS